MANGDKRRHVRIRVDKPVKVRDDAGEYDGQLADISFSGASVNGDALDFDDDQDLELDSEEFGRLTGNVVRDFDDGFAMAFDMDDEAKEDLVDEITGHRSGGDSDYD
jgi:hypothetical protein